MDLRIPIEEALLGQNHQNVMKFKDMAQTKSVTGNANAQRRDILKQAEASRPIIMQDDHDLDPQISIL